MLTSVNIRSRAAVYIQIENEVRFAIASGLLKPGDQLPSARELSERLQLNPNTIAKAYRDLEVMRYVYTRRRMGVFVERNVEERSREDCRTEVISRLFEVVAEAKAAGMAVADLREIIQRCVAIEASPYSDVPDELLQAAVPPKAAKK